MEVIGFAPDEISSMLELLAAILNLGNVTFSSYSLPNSIDACRMEIAKCKYECVRPIQMHITVGQLAARGEGGVVVVVYII